MPHWHTVGFRVPHWGIVAVGCFNLHCFALEPRRGKGGPTGPLGPTGMKRVGHDQLPVEVKTNWTHEPYPHHHPHRIGFDMTFGLLGGTLGRTLGGP